MDRLRVLPAGALLACLVLMSACTTASGPSAAAPDPARPPLLALQAELEPGPGTDTVARLTVRNPGLARTYLMGAQVPGLGMGFVERADAHDGAMSDAPAVGPGDVLALDGRLLRLRFSGPLPAGLAAGETVEGHLLVRHSLCNTWPEGCIVRAPTRFRIAAAPGR